MSFADSFTFARPVAAPYADAAGVTQLAPPDAPRFDHAAPSRPSGLLVEALGADGADRVQLRPRDWSAAREWTILHEWDAGAGVRRDAHYAVDPGAMIDGVLAFAGHHRRVVAIAGFLARHDDWVWALGARWTLPRLLGDRSSRIIGTDVGKPLLAS